MSPRIRLALWALAVTACGLSPVLFRLVAPWAGAAWQCVCLGAILALYATTPADAIKLPKWVSKFLIVGGMVALPALCYGRVTWALVITLLLVVVFDHLPVRPTKREAPKRGLNVSTGWSWEPGVTADWITVVFLWSPASWQLARPHMMEIPEAGLVWGVIFVAWLFVLQFAASEAVESRRRFVRRIGIATAFALLNVLFALISLEEHGV